MIECNNDLNWKSGPSSNKRTFCIFNQCVITARYSSSLACTQPSDVSFCTWMSFLYRLLRSRDEYDFPLPPGLVKKYYISNISLLVTNFLISKSRFMVPTVGGLNHLRAIELSWALKAHLMSGSLPPPISHNGYIYSNPGRNGRKIQCEREKTSCYQQVEEGNYIQYSNIYWQ